MEDSMQPGKRTCIIEFQIDENIRSFDVESFYRAYFPWRMVNPSVHINHSSSDLVTQLQSRLSARSKANSGQDHEMIHKKRSKEMSVSNALNNALQILEKVSRNELRSGCITPCLSEFDSPGESALHSGSGSVLKSSEMIQVSDVQVMEQRSYSARGA